MKCGTAVDNSSTGAVWAPKIASVGAAGIGAVAMAIAAVSLGNDPVGWFLLGVAAVILAIIAVMGFVVRPRLALEPGSPTRLAIRTLSGRREYEKSQIYRLRVVKYPRLGRRVPILEIDIRQPEERLILLTRWDLGMNPDRVFAALEEAGMVPPAPQTPR